MKTLYFINYKYLHPLDIERFKILCSNLTQYEKLDTKLFLSQNKIYTTEMISIKEIVLLLFNQILFKSFINILVIEIYNFSFKAYVSELIYHKKKMPFHKKLIFSPIPFLKIFLFMLIRKNSRTNLISTNKLRINLLSSQNDVKIIRNLPTKKWVYSNVLVNKKITKLALSKYIFLPGRINNFQDLEIVKKFANLNNLKIYICGDHENVDSDNTIVNLGILNPEQINYLIKKCEFGLVIYNNSTLSQIYSSSSKLFEFLVYRKKVIYSMNKGVLDELKFFDIKNCFLIDDRLPSCKVRFENCNEIKIDNRFIYENQIF